MIVTMTDLFEQSVEFVKLHRKGRAFLNYTEDQIRAELLKHISSYNFAFTVDNKCVLTGLATFEIFPSNSLLHIRNLLVSKPKVLRALVEYAAARFPEYSLSGNRMTGTHFYKLDRLLKHL